VAEATSTRSDAREGLERKCPSCGGRVAVRDHQRNIEICESCGRILKEGIKDRGPEWRAFDEEERKEKSRGGPPPTETIHDKGLSTQIDRKNRDAHGRGLSPERRQKMHRLRRWQKRSRTEDGKDRNLAMAFNEIHRMASQLGLPDGVRESASRIYRELSEKGRIRGRSVESLSSAALYIACRENQVPRTLEEVAGASHEEKVKIGRAYRFISRELGIHTPPVDPARYVSRFGSELEISGETRAKAIEFVRRAQEKRFSSGKSPSALAAAALYIAALEEGERRSQREVAEAAGATEVTVRNRYREMAAEFGLDLEVR